MSDEMDRKVKDLMARVVDMAPEAPPFPEESVTLTPVPTRRLRPILVFTGALAAVLLVALPLLLLGGDGGLEPAATSVPAPASTAVPQMGVTVPMVVYLTQDPDNSLQGNPALVAVRGLASALEGEPEVLSALRALVDPALRPPPGLANSIPEGVRVFGATVEGDTVVVDMDPRFLDGAGGLLADITMLNQLIYTATESNPDAGVVFTVGGEDPGAYGTEGILLDAAYTREYYRDQINSVIVTSPIGPESTEISGWANVFEATVSLEIVDAGGEVIDSQFTTATCGTGCWGEYTFTLDPELLEPGGHVRVFWNSPEDGDPSDVVTIPIPESEDGLWDLTP